MTDVIDSVRPDFDELGVDDRVLQELLRIWENKVAQSRVADFTTDPKIADTAKQFPMLPLPEPSSSSAPSAGGAAAAAAASTTAAAAAASTSASASSGPEGAIDGVKAEATDGAAAAPASSPEKPKAEETVIKAPKPVGDDDEINSDLDDSDDDLDGDDEEGAEGGDLVIALYEKVQRVKNKWKVTLKDGIVSVQGREYLFAKCSGEFEW